MAAIKESAIAKVARNDDPLKNGRIQVTCVALTGDNGEVIPEWIEPAHDWGWFYVPDVGESVEIEYVVSDDTGGHSPGMAFLECPRMEWRGKRFRNEASKDGARLPDERMTGANYGKRRGFVTPNGHILFFDDTKGEEQITLSWKAVKKDGTAVVSYLSFDKNGGVTLSGANGSHLFIDVENGVTSLIHAVPGNPASSHVLSMDAGGFKVIDAFSNFIEMKDGFVRAVSAKELILNAGAGCQIIAKEATVKADKVTVDSLDVNIGTGADSRLVRLQDFITLFDGHMHPTAALGPPSPPAPPFLASTTPTLGTLTVQAK